MQPGERKAERRADSDLDRKFWLALALYGILAGLAWFTLGEDKVLVPWFDVSDWKFFAVVRPVQMRLVPLIVLGGFALRTVLARQAEKYRRELKEAEGSSSESL